jgi:4-amino-4-deoxy-L-arabinose transferase-like glycosyltransferase
VTAEEAPAASVARVRPGPVAIASWVDAHARMIIGAFSLVYLAVTLAIAARLPLTNDEYFTYYIARAHGLQGIWRALRTGAEQTPPLSHVLARASMELFGNTRLAIRLPEVLAYLGASICLYAIVAARSSRLIGLIAMVFPSVTAAYVYALDARSYALVLLFASLALLSWQRIASGDRFARVGLAGALALAVASNYYAVLLLLPLGLGEAVRVARARRLDVRTLLAFGGVVVPLVAFLPLIEASRRYSAHFYGTASWRDPTDFYAFLANTSLLPTSFFVAHDRALLALTLIAVALLLLVIRHLPRRGVRLALLAAAIGLLPSLGLFASQPLFGVTSIYLRELAVVLAILVVAGYVVLRARSGRPLFPSLEPAELAAVSGFVLLPLATVLLAKAGTGAFQFRYALPAVLGMSVLLPQALYRLEGGRSAVCLVVLVALAVGFLGYARSEWGFADRSSAHQQAVFSVLEQRSGSRLPILIAHPHDYLELASVAPRSLAARFIYLADPAATLRFDGSDTVELGLIEMAKLGPLHVLSYGPFVARRPHFLALVTFHTGTWNWVFPQLRADGLKIRLRASHGSIQLYDVGP